MTRFFTVFTIFTLLFSKTYSSEHFTGSQASAKIKGASELWYKSNNNNPSYVRFDKDFVLTAKDVVSWIKEEFKIPTNVDFFIYKTFESTDGSSHVIYSSTYNETEIEFLRFTVHFKGNRVIAISGKFPTDYTPVNSINMSESQALSLALENIGAKTYKWQVPEEELWIKQFKNDPSATYNPRIELVLLDGDLDFSKTDLHYVYKMNVYAHEPLSSQDIYIDAGSGELMFKHSSIHELDSTGVAHTAFSGLREIKSLKDGIVFQLNEKDRGQGITTWDLNNSVALGAAVHFTDEDNVWQFSQGDLDIYATDAHWATEVTYDFLEANFQRNSIDNSGFALNSFMHYGEAYNNARWDNELKVMLYGDGANNMIPYSTLDIVGHEIGHGLTSFTADLIYQNESGALNESFSDILGNCVEYFGKGGVNWRIGEDRGSFIRDMSFPNAKDQPDTYGGTHWYNGSLDNGGVHINSGVQNFWFYLLAEGGNGINDNSISYDVNGIGIMNASLIAYRTLSVYLDPTSDYEDVSFFSTVSAIDIFGNCSVQHESTAKAWQAVGIENEFIEATKADFIVDKVEFCNVPFSIAFVNNSENGQEFFWEFGDGTTSTESNPIHTYNSVGEFDVKLSVDGKGCGVDELLKNEVIKVYDIDQPFVEDVDVFKGDSVALIATSAVGEIHWYSDEKGLNLLTTGNLYQTPALEETTRYYTNTISTSEVNMLGPSIEENQVKGQYSNMNIGLDFETYQDLFLTSVKVKAQQAGERMILIKDVSTGVVVFQKLVNLEEGVQTIELNAELNKGMFEIYYTGNIKGLWIANTGNFPYNKSGLLSINGNSLDIENNYPFFFDWMIQEKNCESELVEVLVSVEDIKNINKPIYNFYVNDAGDFNYFIDFFFKENTSVEFRLYGINGQLIDKIDQEFFKGSNTVDVNRLFLLENQVSGVFFVSIRGGGLEKTEKIVNKGGVD